MSLSGLLADEWKKTVVGVVILASITGIGAAADNRWMRKVDFQEWVQEERRSQTLDTIRELEIEINALESEIAYTDDPRRAAALEERIRFLEAQIDDLERRL